MQTAYIIRYCWRVPMFSEVGIVPLLSWTWTITWYMKFTSLKKKSIVYHW